MIKYLTAIFALLFLFRTLPAQVLTIAEVLATAERDTRYNQNQALQTTAQGLKVHDPVLRQIALRVGINGSALGDTIFGYLRNEDTYQLQVGFNSFLERQRQKQVKNAQVAAIAAESRVLKEEALFERYEALAGYLFVVPKRAACLRLDSLLEKEHRILREMLATGTLDVKVSKVLDAEEDRNRNQLALQELDNTATAYHNRLRQLAGNFSQIDQNDLILLSDVRARVAALKVASAFTLPLFESKMADIQLEKARLNYISAQNRQILSNFSAGYQRPLYVEMPKRFNPANNFNVRVGLTVPLPSNNHYKKSAALLDLRKAENEAAWTSEKLRNEIENQFVRVENLFKKHELIQERLENSLIRKMLDNPDLRNQITPLEIVEMEIAQQKLQINKADILASIMFEYVQLLSLSGAIGQEGAINYLVTIK